jgi:hypothetical protein
MELLAIGSSFLIFIQKVQICFRECRTCQMPDWFELGKNLEPGGAPQIFSLSFSYVDSGLARN